MSEEKEFKWFDAEGKETKDPNKFHHSSSHRVDDHTTMRIDMFPIGMNQEPLSLESKEDSEMTSSNGVRVKVQHDPVYGDTTSEPKDSPDPEEGYDSLAELKGEKEEEKPTGIWIDMEEWELTTAWMNVVSRLAFFPEDAVLERLKTIMNDPSELPKVREMAQNIYMDKIKNNEHTDESVDSLRELRESQGESSDGQ